MSKIPPLSEHSRQELYELIWSVPALQLAAQFGISSVAIGKRCKRLCVPRPPRGYWAKVEAGQTPRKTPLPPTAGEVFIETLTHRPPRTLPLPGSTEEMLPLASDLWTAINKARLDRYKRACLESPLFPQVTVSKVLAERAAKTFHVLLKEMEPLGICFRKFKGKYDPGYFEWGRDRLYLAITEELVGPDATTRVSPWQWPPEKASPCGFLTFGLKSDRYLDRDVKEWSESAKVPLEKSLALVGAGIRSHYLELQKRREREKIEAEKRYAEWLIQREEWERAEALRLAEEKKRKHAEAIAAAVEARKKTLLQAAAAWQQSNLLLEFITACATRWKSETGEVTPGQLAWLTWARGIGDAMSPFSVSYPDPTIDGAFDPNSIPVGGPYPEIKKLSEQRSTTSAG